MKANLMVTGLTANINNQVNQLGTVAPKGNVPETYIMRGIPTWQGENGESLVRDGYAGNATVYSIIKLITDKAKVAPWYVYKEKNKAKAKMYQAKMKHPDKIENWAEIRQLKEEAYELFDGDQRLNELLKYPNSEDTWNDLIEKVCMYKLINGNSFTYAKMIEFGNNAGKPFTLHVLPSQYMSILVDIVPFPAEKTGYQLYFGRQVTFTKEEVLQDCYANPTWSVTGAELYGLPPLKAAALDLTRNRQSSIAVVSAYANEAPVGIVYVKAGQQFDPQASGDAMKALKSDLAGKSGYQNRGKLPISSYEMGFTAIGFTPEDMEFVINQKWDKEVLCGVFHVPPPLIGSSDATTYNNIKTFERMLTAGCALPLLQSYRDNFNRKLSDDWGYKNSGIMVDYDVKCYPELEADRQVQANWTDMVPMTLENRYNIMELDADTLPPDVRKKVLYKGQEIDDFQQITPPEDGE